MSKQKFERTKPHMNVGTMGHIDHGKTTLTAAITKYCSFSNKAEYRAFESIDLVSRGLPVRFRPSACRAPRPSGRIIAPYHTVYGQIPKWPKGADCKSAGRRLRRFESFTAHLVYSLTMAAL